MTFIGLAFGGGIALAAMSGSSGRRVRRYNSPSNAGSSESSSRNRVSTPPSPAMEKAQKAIENIKGALVGLAASRVKEYADQIIPGFSKHYQNAEAEQSTVSPRV